MERTARSVLLTSLLVFLLGMTFSQESDNFTVESTIPDEGPEHGNASSPVYDDDASKLLYTEDSFNASIEMVTDSPLDEKLVMKKPPNLQQLASQHIMFKIAVALQTYYYPIVAPIGLVGNILSLLVMRQPENIRNPSCIYLSVLAVTDSLCLLSVLNYWAGTDSIPPVKRIFTDFECKFFNYLYQNFLMSGIFLTVSMSVSRMLAVRFPLRVARWNMKKKAKIGSVICPLVASILTIPVAISSEIFGAGARQFCRPFMTHDLFTKIYVWVVTAINLFIPFSVLLITNAVIIGEIVKAEKSMGSSRSVKSGEDARTSSSSSEKISAKWSAEKHVTAMMLLVSTAFLIFNSPRLIRDIYYQINTYHSPEGYAAFVLTSNIGGKLGFTNSAANFFLYCLSGRKFREDLWKLVTRRDNANNKMAYLSGSGSALSSCATGNRSSSDAKMEDGETEADKNDDETEENKKTTDREASPQHGTAA